MNKVLVTGATGFIGANLTRRLISEGYDVHILTRETSNKWRLFDILNKVNNHIVDLRNFDKLKKIIEKIQPDIIFHLATAGVYGGKHLPEKDVIDINFVGTYNLINACDNINYKCFINTGTSSEYGPKNESMKETDVCNPINMYGVTKLASTLYGSYIANFKNKPIITFRLFSPFGPYDDTSRLITYSILNALEGKDIYLANPNAVRDYIYIEEIINSYLNIIKNAENLKGEIFNIGSGKEIKISYVIKKILELTESKSKIFWNKVPPREFDASHWEADINKSKNMLDFNINIDFDKGLKKTVEWFKENKNLYKNG